MFKVLVYGLCLISLLVSCDSQTQVSSRPFLVVNGEDLSRDQFLAAFNRTLHPEQKLSDKEKEELQRSFLIQLIDRKLMHAEAKRLGIKISPAEVEAALTVYRKEYPDEPVFQAMLTERGLSLQAWQEELKESLIMESLLERAVYSQVEVNERDISNYYEEHRDDFNRPEQVRARQIVVADESEGRRLLGLLRQGEDFETMARQHSMSPDSEDGGDLGFFGHGKMPPEFDAVVFDMPVGRLSELVKSDYGYHIFLVEEKRKAKRLSKQEAAEEIRPILLEKKREVAYYDWLQTLRAEADIAVDWDQLTTLQDKAED